MSRTSWVSLVWTLLVVAGISSSVPPLLLVRASVDRTASLNVYQSMNRKLQGGSCVPQQYPKQGTLLPITLPEKVVDVVWTGKPKGNNSSSPYAFVTTLRGNGFPGGSLWRSDYYGKGDSWKDVTDELKKSLPEGAGADDDVGVTAIHVSPVDADVILLQGHGGWHWSSKDGGQSFSSMKTPNGTLGRKHIVKFHPRQKEWILLRTERNACLHNRGSKDCVFDLYVTKDLGQTWTELGERSQGHVSGFRDFEWGAKMTSFDDRPTKDDDVFVTAYPGDVGKKGMASGWDEKLQFFFSNDLFASAPKMTVQCGNLFEIISDRILLALPSECPYAPDGSPRKSGKGTIKNRSVTMYVSVHGVGFVEACLPADLEDDGYNLMHTHDGTGVIVLADHAEPGSRGPSLDSPTADAYTPAYNASLHTLSLERVYRRSYITDFSRVEGVTGYYIANQVDDSGSPYSLKNYLKTKMSYNGGSSWKLVSPPTNFRYSQCNTCPAGASLEECSLHLHGPTSWFAPEGPHPNVYSVESAPGVILSTGNVGAHLDFHPDADCTYISRDGGETWQDIAPNTAIYEVGSTGGTVVMASHRSEGPTDEVQFSLDQGACFHKVKLPQSMLVENIRVDSERASNVFLIIGTACVKSSTHPDCSFTGGSNPPGLMYAIDLPDVVGGDWRVCDIGKDSEDYENFTFKGGACILGAQRTMQRRSAEKFCADPPSWNPSVEKGNDCQCTYEDVECEFGYERKDNKTCTPMKQVDLNEACPRLLGGSYKASSSNMRLVHGDVCTGINDIIPDTNGKGGAKGSPKPGSDSPDTDHDSGGGGFMHSVFVFIFVIGAISVAIGLAWTHCISIEQRQVVLEKLGPILQTLEAGFEVLLGFCVEAYDWIRAKVRSLPFVPSGDDQDIRGYYEALSGSGGLDLDPEDHSSPNVFPGPVQQ